MTNTTLPTPEQIDEILTDLESQILSQLALKERVGLAVMVTTFTERPNPILAGERIDQADFERRILHRRTFGTEKESWPEDYEARALEMGLLVDQAHLDTETLMRFAPWYWSSHPNMHEGGVRYKGWIVSVYGLEGHDNYLQADQIAKVLANLYPLAE